MAPVKKPQPGTRKGSKPSSGSSSTSKPRSKSKDVKRPPPKQVKTKPTTLLTKPKKAKKSVYTDAQLNLPSINGIVPANAAAKTGRGAGKKKNKVFVDDTESMMTILAMVNAEKEGQIESKVLKARQMEEIREARRKEAEKRAEGKKGKFEEVKMGLKRKGKDNKDVKVGGEEAVKKEGRPKRKSVSFAT